MCSYQLVYVIKVYHAEYTYPRSQASMRYAQRLSLAVCTASDKSWAWRPGNEARVHTASDKSWAWRPGNEARVHTASNKAGRGGLGMRPEYILQATKLGVEAWE